MSAASAVSALHVSLGTLGLLLVLVVVVYGRISCYRLRKQYRGVAPRALTDDERSSLARWQARSIGLFVAFMVLVVPIAVLATIAQVGPSVRLLVYLLFLAGAIAGIGHAFSARCPACGRRVAFQSSLVVPSCCEICGASLKRKAARKPG